MAENPVIWYNVYHQASWGNLIGTYMFLAAVAAGSLGVATLPRLFGRDKLRDIEMPSIVIGLASLVLLGLILIYDLGRPLRFVNLILHPQASSPMTWATFLFGILGLTGLGYGLSVYTDRPEGAKWFAWATLIVGIVTMLSNGLELSAVEARLLWSQGAVLPVLYLATAMASGLSVGILVSLFRKSEASSVTEMGGYLAWTVGLVLFSYGAYFVGILYQGEVAVYELGILLSSPLSLWVGVILGALVPLILLVAATKLLDERQRGLGNGATALSAVLVLVGVWAFRMAIVSAGYQAQILW